MPKWTSANRPITQQDIVLWYTMGITHISRPEEWPVMSWHRAGFKLVLNGFFARNPALDVPKPELGTPEEVAEVVVWLCSDAASFITGHALAVDGGMVAQ